MATLASRAGELRRAAAEAFFGGEAERVARACEAMAERFAAGGQLLALAATPAARSDARHVAVEFVHPVIVGKRALPALALTGEDGAPERQVQLLAKPRDVVLGLGTGTAAALARARQAGCLTVSDGAEAQWTFAPGVEDPFVHQELIETLYHVLWELVHVFFEHRGGVGGGDPGPAGFLYPFLAEPRSGAGSVLEDVRASVLIKAREAGELRAATLRAAEATLAAAAGAMRERLDRGGRVLALGNGGSATDAMDAAIDLREPPFRWPARAAIDLAEDPSVLTAIANDVGVEATFSRQVIAHGDEGDVLLAFSTSGGSANVLAALAEARARGLLTVAFAGYGGAGVQADHLVAVDSQDIPRIQEAHASAWHVLRELIEL